MSNLEDACAATIAKMEADKKSKDELHNRRVAIWKMYHEDDIAKKDISVLLAEKMRLAGISEDKIKGGGFGYYSIRQIVEGPNPV